MSESKKDCRFYEQKYIDNDPEYSNWSDELSYQAQQQQDEDEENDEH